MALIIPEFALKEINDKGIAVFWFRRDLRLHDNAGLYQALKSDFPVLPLFIFDTNILDDLEDKADARVEFIHQTISSLNQQLAAESSALLTTYGDPIEVWKLFVEKYPVRAVYTNHDYEPYALKRDAEIAQVLAKKEIDFFTFKDHVIFEKEDVLKDDETPYTVFTPYSRKWKQKLASGLPEKGLQDLVVSAYLQSFDSEKFIANFANIPPLPLPGLEEIGFKPAGISFPPNSVNQGLIRNYDKTRNFPGIEGTSRLGIHFRFGTISIRQKAKKAIGLNETFLNELIWRDFYAMILAWFPQVVGQPFRKKYDFIEWRNNESEFDSWCEGKTGYPIVDAGMRELEATGYMHNRVRMITASFLTKHLLIDWRWGEAWFAKKLLDYDLASNNGGWQWAAGCGTDAAPYFRIFNPYSQQEKFDKAFVYIKRWVPEYGTDHPSPIVDHKFARERCLKVYKEGLAKAEP